MCHLRRGGTRVAPRPAQRLRTRRVWCGLWTCGALEQSAAAARGVSHRRPTYVCVCVGRRHTRAPPWPPVGHRTLFPVFTSQPCEDVSQDQQCIDRTGDDLPHDLPGRRSIGVQEDREEAHVRHKVTRDALASESDHQFVSLDAARDACVRAHRVVLVHVLVGMAWQ